jgi:peptide/nickel transport system permease protein
VGVYVARRLAVLALSLFAASILTFAVLSVLPGDPAQVLLGQDATPATLHALRQQLGLDHSLVVRYLDWAGGFVHGDLGVSAYSQQPIAPTIGSELAITGPLVLASLVLALAVSLPLGVLAALRRRRLSGVAITTASQIGIAIPEFWAGILLITVVSVDLGWLPAGFFPDDGWGDVGGAVRALILPVVSLALIQASILTRFVRSAGGLSRAAALRRHGLRNAAFPLVTVVGLQVAGLLAGAVVVEQVFSLNGLGRALLHAATQRDTQTVQDIAMLLTATVLVVSLLVDVAYRLLDPRLRDAR